MAIPFKSSITLGQIFAQNNDFRILTGGANKLSITNNSTLLSNTSVTISGSSSLSLTSGGSWSATSGYGGSLNLGSSSTSFSRGQQILSFATQEVQLNSNNSPLNIQAGTNDITLSGETITLNDSTDVILAQQGMNDNSVSTVDYVWLNKIANPLLYTIDYQYNQVEKLYFANNCIYKFKINEDMANQAINTKGRYNVSSGPICGGESINSTAMDTFVNILGVGYINGNYIIASTKGIYRSTNYLFSSPTVMNSTDINRIIASPKIVMGLSEERNGFGYTTNGTTWNRPSINTGTSTFSTSQGLITPSYAYVNCGNGTYRASLSNGYPSSVNFTLYTTDANVGRCVWDGKYVVEIVTGSSPQLKYRNENLSLIKTITLDCRFNTVGEAVNYTFWDKVFGILYSDETLIYLKNGCYVIKTNIIGGDTNSYDSDNQVIYNPATDSVWYLGDAGGSSTIAAS